ncbi:MAG: anti-sigma factor [Gammaproteobacteria bacterium]|nr:anti-sigma factor [Gammaproteobacteria bacterium]
MRDNINDTEIHAYLDQQLTPEQALEFEERIKHDPLAQKKLAEYQSIEDSLNGLYQPIMEESIPPQLLNACKKKSYNYLAMAASILFFVVGWLSGTQLNTTNPSSNDSLVEDLKTPAIFAHSVYSVEKLHPVEVKADKQQHMNHWLSKRLKTTLKAPDLSKQDFELVGGRLLPSTKERMAAQFMYQNIQGERITLYVKRGNWISKETAINSTQKTLNESSFNVSYWVDDDLGYVLTGKIDQITNRKLSESIYQQMSLNTAQLIAQR